MACDHNDFAAVVEVSRIESSTGGKMRYSADVKIHYWQVGCRAENLIGIRPA